MSLVWTSAAIGSVMLALIVALICRERLLRKQLAECRVLIASLTDGLVRASGRPGQGPGW